MLFTGNRNNTLGLRKKKYFDRDLLLAILFCGIATLIGVIFMQHEIHQDAWFIQSSADGLFGDENKSIFVLGAHYLLTGIIYLLSFLDTRIFWYNVFIGLANIGSTFIVGFVILKTIKGKLRYVLILLSFLMLTVFSWFQLEFTVSSVFAVSAGMLLLFYCGDVHAKKRYYAFAILWIVFGYCIRIDSLYIPMAFWGVIGIYKLICIGKKNSYDFSLWIKESKRYLFSFAAMFLIVFLLYFSYIGLMNHYEPGFLKWNAVRTQIDDYSLPAYESHEKEYKKIGLSENDVALVKTWNYMDPEIFTLDKMKEILDVKAEILAEEREDLGLIKSTYAILRGTIDAMMSSAYFFVLIGIFILCLFYTKKDSRILSVLMLFLLFGLAIVFFMKGRLISRIQMCLILNCLLALLYLVCTEQSTFAVSSLKWKKIAQSAVAVVVILSTLSMVNTYRVWALNGHNFITGRILAHQGIYMKHATYDYNLSKEISGDTKHFYYFLWNEEWLQQYPLNAVSLLKTAPVGTSHNQAFLSQYLSQLSASQNILKEQGVDNPFLSLYQPNVMVESRTTNAGNTRLIRKYLQEHYFPTTSVSIVRYFDDIICVRYMQDIDTAEKDYNKKFGVSVDKHKLCETGTVVRVHGDMLPYDKNNDEIYLRMTDSKGKTYTYCRLEEFRKSDTKKNKEVLFAVDSEALNRHKISSFSVIIKNETGMTEYTNFSMVLK